MLQVGATCAFTVEIKIGNTKVISRIPILNQFFLSQYKSGNVDVNHDPENIDNPSDKGITHHRGIEPQTLENDRQCATAQTPADDHGKQRQRDHQSITHIGSDKNRYHPTDQ